MNQLIPPPVVFRARQSDRLANKDDSSWLSHTHTRTHTCPSFCFPHYTDKQPCSYQHVTHLLAFLSLSGFTPNTHTHTLNCLLWRWDSSGEGFPCLVEVIPEQPSKEISSFVMFSYTRDGWTDTRMHTVSRRCQLTPRVRVPYQHIYLL